MKYLPAFEYLTPQNVDELHDMQKQLDHNYKIIAGGTDLIVSLKRKELFPKYIIDITGIPDFHKIYEDEHNVYVGSTITHNEIVESNLLNRELPLLCEAAQSIGSKQIRNAGTIGGNLANASPAADCLSPLIALEAQICLLNPKGSKKVLLQDIYLSPYSTNLTSEDVLVKIIIPKLKPGSGSSFIKLGRRNALAISRINVATILNVNKHGMIENAKIAPGAVMPQPSRIKRAEDHLHDSYPDYNQLFATSKLVSEEVIKVTGIRSSTAYKEPVLSNLVERSLITALERCF